MKDDLFQFDSDQGFYDEYCKKYFKKYSDDQKLSFFVKNCTKN